MKSLTRWAVPALVATLAIALSATAAAPQEASAPGVTNKSVKLGYIFTETGALGSTFNKAGKACQARIGRANAEGGVNGRKIDMEYVDDQSNANLTAAQDLVQNRKVFAVINNSPLAFLSYRYLLEQGVPVVGGGYDGTYYGKKGNESILVATGSAGPLEGLTYDMNARMMKRLGVTKLATLAYSSPSAVAGAKAVADYAAPGVGIKSAYLNTSIDFGTADAGPIVLGIKNAGADGVYMLTVAETNLAVLEGLMQNNVQTKANLLLTGYGQDLLDSPVAATLKPNTVISQGFKPVELHDAATKRFQADLKKYGGLTGVPDFGVYLGYLACDVAVTALQHAGKTPTRQSFLDGFRSINTYDMAGLAAGKGADVSLANYGKFADTACSYFLYVKNRKFVIMNHKKPVCGKLVGAKDLLDANRAGAASAAATTTSAP